MNQEKEKKDNKENKVKKDKKVNKVNKEEVKNIGEEINKKEKTKNVKTEKSITEKITTKKTRKVISAEKFILIVSLVIALYTALILFVNLAVNKDSLYNFDWTYSHIYKLSKESKELIKSIDEPVEITIDSRLNYSQVTEILDQIVKLNSLVKVTVTEITNQEEGEEQTEEQNFYGTVIINAPDREEMAFSFFDLNFDASLINKDTYKQYSIFEEKLMNSIISVLKGETVETSSVAFLTGLEGSEIADELLNLYTELRSFGIVSMELDLKEQDIPESIKTIAIIGPMKDITQAEYNKLIDFQARGGNFVIAATFIEDKLQPRFEKFLSSYGVTLPVGAVIEYKDGYRYAVLQSNDLVRNYNNILLPIPTSNSDITKDMEFEGTAPFFVFPTKIVSDSKEDLVKKNVTHTNSILTSDKAIFKKDDITEDDLLGNDLPENTVPEIFVLGTIADKKIADNVNSKAIIYSNYLFMSDLVVQDLIEDELILQKDNLRLAKNSFTYLHPLKDEMLDIKKGLIVSPYKYDSTKVTLHKSLTYLFFAIPSIVILGIGAFTLYKRGYLVKYGVEYKERNIKESRKDGLDKR